MKLEAAYFASMAIVATLLVAAPASAQGPAQTDWTKRVTMSDKGGHIIGNPLAKHALAEYMSYTCNHCANFDAQSHTPLTNSYIKTGRLRFEIRNLVLNSIDLTAAMLARCGGRTKFYGNHRAFLKQQPSWLAKFQSTPPAVRKTLNEGTVPQRMMKIAKAAGFYDIMQKRGYSKAQVNSCLSNKAEQTKILSMTKYATQTLKLTGTPSFTLDGDAIAKVHDWTALQRRLVTLPK